jgi:hypothetical protein
MRQAERAFAFTRSATILFTPASVYLMISLHHELKSLFTGMEKKRLEGISCFLLGVLGAWRFV